MDVDKIKFSSDTLYVPKNLKIVTNMICYYSQRLFSVFDLCFKNQFYLYFNRKFTKENSKAPRDERPVITLESQNIELL